MLRLLLALLLLAPALARADTAAGDQPEPFTIDGDDPMSLTVAHHFATRAEARARITQLLEYWARRFGVKAEWRGYRAYCTGRLVGVDFRAQFEVLDGEVTAKATNPGLLLRGPAHGYVEKKLKKYLHPDYVEP